MFHDTRSLSRNSLPQIYSYHLNKRVDIKPLDQHVWAVGLFAYAGISDLIDGWIARKWKLQTVVGSVIDPMADKFLMTVLVGCLAAKGALPRKFLHTPGFRYQVPPDWKQYIPCIVFEGAHLLTTSLE